MRAFSGFDVFESLGDQVFNGDRRTLYFLFGDGKDLLFGAIQLFADIPAFIAGLVQYLAAGPRQITQQTFVFDNVSIIFCTGCRGNRFNNAHQIIDAANGIQAFAFFQFIAEKNQVDLAVLFIKSQDRFINNAMFC